MDLSSCYARSLLDELGSSSSPSPFARTLNTVSGSFLIHLFPDAEKEAVAGTMAEPFTSSGSTRSSSCKGTTPHTIEQAVEAFRRRKQQQPCGQQFDSAPIDLVAVVLDVIVKNTTDTPFCQIWIRDASLSDDSCCQVLLFGTPKVRRAAQQLKLQRGDVVRFNRVHLLSDRARRDDGLPVYTFRHSFQDPEAGVEYFRLLQVDGGGAATAPPRVQIDESIQAVPDSMRTDATYLESLVAWYKSSEFCVKTTTLPPLTCQYRSLSELQSCQGVVSHVVATVLQVETDTAANHRLSSMKKKRRRRSSPSGVEAPPPTYATLTDDDGKTVTSFFLDNRLSEHQRFQKVLSDACDAKQPVRFSSVVAKTQRADSSRSKHDEVLLWPTANTDIALATERELEQRAIHQRNEATQGATQASWALSLSQHQSNARQLEIRSPLLDIRVNGVSLVRNQARYLQDNPSELHSFFRSNNDEHCYSTAIVTIKDAGLGRMDAKADGTIVQSLCGGVDLEELRNDGSSLPAEIGELAFNLLRGLLNEGIELRWVILESTAATTNDKSHEEDEEADTEYRVHSVSLPRLL